MCKQRWMVWSLNHCILVWFVAQSDPSFQPTVKIWINNCGGNVMPMVPYAHPLHMKWFQHITCDPHWCASSFGWVWSLNHCTMVWFVAQQCDPSFQPTVKIWINNCGGNGMPMVPYTHPLHMKWFKHIICDPHWFASSFGWVWTLNHCIIAWFVAQQCDPSFQPTDMDQHGQW